MVESKKVRGGQEDPLGYTLKDLQFVNLEISYFGFVLTFPEADMMEMNQ